MSHFDVVRIGLLSVSDRASAGVYADQGIPALIEWLKEHLQNPLEFVEKLLPDTEAEIAAALRSSVDDHKCSLVFTTGGTGPALRDVTPEATLAVATKTMPGFGEQMRAISLHFVPTAILSRQVAVIRGTSLIVNLPGQPKSIREILGGVHGKVEGIFSAIPYCIDLLGGPYIETHAEKCRAFRPKSAVRTRAPESGA